MSLGSKMKSLRRLRGFTQATLAVGIVTHGMLSRIEHVDAMPSLETLLALAMRGVGACFLPSELVASSYYDFETSGLHIIELGKEMSYSVSVAWRRTDHVWSAIESFAQVLSEQRYVVKRGE